MTMPSLTDKFYLPILISGSLIRLSMSPVFYMYTSTLASNRSVNTSACSYREGEEDSRMTVQSRLPPRPWLCL